MKDVGMAISIYKRKYNSEWGIAVLKNDEKIQQKRSQLFMYLVYAKWTTETILLKILPKYSCYAETNFDEKGQ